MTAAGEVHLSIEAGIGRLELHRPDCHNAVDQALNDALARALDEIEGWGPRLRCLIVAGAGRSFSSGADLKLLERLSPSEARRFMIDATSSFRRIGRLPLPVVAAVRGYCLGGGFELLLHCDLAVAAEDAQLGLPEAALGLTTTSGSVARLVAAVGAMRAKDLLLTGRRLRAAEAHAAGLVAEVVPGDRLEESVLARARAFVSQPPEGLAAMKRLLALRLDEGATASFLAEVESFEALLRAREGRGG